MPSFDGKVSVIGEVERNRGAKESTTPKYNVLAVHGLGSMGVKNAAWTSNQETDATSWVTNLLPAHAPCSRLMTFDYSCEEFHEGVSIDNIKGLAITLLDQLLGMVEPSAYVVFIAHDIGGLIVKEALSIAIQSSKYHIISGMTSLLVFFGTPHRVSGLRSWESIASWLLQVAGGDISHSAQWVIETAQMLRAANEGFDSMRNMYTVINVHYRQTSPSTKANALVWQALDSDSAKMGTHGEIIIGRDEPHADIVKFSGKRDEAFVKIYQELRISKGPGIQYMQCLNFLSGLASPDGFAKQLLTFRGDGHMESGALRQLEGNEMYKAWRQGTTNTLYIRGHLGVDASRLLSQTTSSSDTIGISFTYDARDSPHRSSAQLFASLCHQMLCLRPQLFDHVSELYKLYSEKIRWRPRLRVFFSSLLGCPFQGHTVCLIQHTDEMRNAQLLEDIATMTSGAAKNFKLIVTANSSAELWELVDPAPVVCIDVGRHNLESIVDSGVNSLLSKRPGLSAVGGKFREMLRGKLTDNLELLGLPEPSIASIIKVWLMLLLDVADPVTNSSIRQSELLMVTKTEDIHRELLCRIPHRRRQNARNALSWMTRTFRPLTLDELAIAIVFELDRKSIAAIEEEAPVDLAWDLDVNFGELVQVDSGQIVHMCDSLQDHMLRQQPAQDDEWPFPLDSHRTIARKCLSYISLRIQQGLVELPNSADGRSDLLSYSVRHWPSHYKEDSAGPAPESNAEQSESQEFDVFNDQGLMQKWAQLYSDSQPPGMECESTHPLVVAVEVECSDLARALLKGQTHSPDILTTALEAAIKIGDESLIRMLMASGATSDIALHIAAMSGRPKLLKLFHKTEADLKSENSQGFKPLHCACQSGYLSVVKELLHIGSDAKAKSNKTGQTPLHIACQFGHLDIIACLLASDANANERDDSGFTPLHVACKWQQADSVSWILNKLKAGQSIDVDARSQSSTTPLHLAAGSGRVDIVKLLFDSHKDPRAGTGTQDKIRELLGTKNADGSTPLHLAAAGGHSAVVRELLSFETDKDPIAVLDRDNRKCIPLHLAVKSGCSEVVNQLLGRKDVLKEQIMSQAGLSSGAFSIHLAVIYGHFTILELLCKAHQKLGTSLNLFNWSSLSPLHVAATCGQVDIVELLLDNNATANIFDWDHATPLFFASHEGHAQIVNLLLEKGADPNTETGDGSTPLLTAAAAGYLEIVQLLLKKGAYPSSKDNDGVNPVLAATEGGFATVVDLLLKNGADADTKSRDGSSLLMIAAKCGHTGVIRILIRDRSGLINTKNRSDLSPLMLAAKGGHAEVTEFLLEKGADPNTEGAEGRKAIHFAAESGDLKTIQLLLYHPKVVEANGTDSKLRTPLHFAVGTKSLNAVNEFLQAGASPTAEDKDGISPLDLEASEELMEKLLSSTELNKMADPSHRGHVLDKALRKAASRGHLRVIRELINREANLKTLDESDRTLYHLAADGGRTEVIRLLYELKIPGFNQLDGAKRTPVSYASEKGHLTAVELLAVKAPKSVRLPDQKGRTPLFYAGGCEQTSVAEYLLENTDAVEDVDKADSTKLTPLGFAARRGHTPIVRALLRHKANPDIAGTDNGCTPLHYAAARGIPEMVSLLLDSNASMNAQDSDKRTPLFRAVWYGREEVASILINKHASDTPDDSGWRALHAAYDSPKIIELLLTELHVDVNSTTRGGSTALHLSVGRWKKSAIVLLNFGADPLKQDSDKITPLHLAATNKVDEDLFGLLLRKAKGPLDVKDSANRTALVAAIENSNQSAVELLMSTGQFVLSEVGKDEKSVVDVATEANSNGVMDAILRLGGASIPTESIEKIFVWALEKDHSDLKEQTMQILRERNPTALAESNVLFSLATKTDDMPLAKFLQGFGVGSETRDEHGWTLSQVVAAFESPARMSMDTKHSAPSRWSVVHSSENAEVRGEDGLGLKYGSESASSIATARSDHPIPPSRRFYFEINVVKGSQESLGIGFSHSNSSKERMPGWDDNSWGLHGDNGGMYHADDIWRSINDDWKYGTDDCIGCCIDPRQRRAFFTRNGTIIDACFTNLHGRLFPMVSFGEDDEIIANFGADTASKPFKFPEGKTRKYRVSEEIS